MRKLFKKYLSLIVVCLTFFVFNNNASAQIIYTVSCPISIPDPPNPNIEYEIVVTCGVPTQQNPNPPATYCECPDIDDPQNGPVYVVHAGQDGGLCFPTAPTNTINTPPPTLLCTGGAEGYSPVYQDDDQVTVNGDRTLLIPNQPPPPSTHVLLEGFWVGFMDQAVPGLGQELVLNNVSLTGPHSNEGVDDPNKDIFYNSVGMALPYCSLAPDHEVYDLWRATLKNADHVPSAVDPNSNKTTYQVAMTGGIENPGVTLKQQVLDILAAKPFDIGRTLLVNPSYPVPVNPTTYLTDAAAYAETLRTRTESQGGCIYDMGQADGLIENITGIFDPHYR